MKRRPGEPFDIYKTRRGLLNKSSRLILKGTRTVLPGFFKPTTPESRTDVKWKAEGKRHAGESPADFKIRRKIVNAKRKKREQARNQPSKNNRR